MLEVKSMLQNFNINTAERKSIIKDWLGRQGLQLLGTLIQSEQETCNDEEGLFVILNKTIKPKHNETIKPLQFHNLIRQYNKRWVGLGQQLWNAIIMK